MKEAFIKHKRLELPKCKLRFLRKHDRKQLALLANNPLIAGNLRNTFPHPYTKKEADNFLKFVNENDRDLILAIEVDRNLAGIIGLNSQEDIHRYSLEAGYWLGVDFWNRGIMSCALSGLVEWVFLHTDIVRIYSNVFATNPASIRVLEKCGFMKEGEFKKSVFKNGRFTDELRYAKLNNKFK